MANLSVDPFSNEVDSNASALFSMDTKSLDALHGHKMEISWMDGPHSSPALYMDEATVASLCGAHVRFTCAGVASAEVFSPRARAPSRLATNGQDLFAVAEVGLRPAVVVYRYPELRQYARLEDGAELEYLCVAFSASSERFAAFSGVPDFTVFLWEISSQAMIAKLEIGFAQSPQLSFCDLDTPHVALTSEVGVTVMQMEEFGEECRLTPRQAELAQVRSHCWEPSGDLYCSRRERIYQISIDTMEVTELAADHWEAGTIVSVVCHAKGLFAAMDDGKILLLELQSGLWRLRIVADLELPVQTMRPSPSFNFIAITCKTGQIRLLYAPSHDYKAVAEYEAAAGPAVAACLLAPQHDYIVSVHEPHGLHVWWTTRGKHENSVELMGRLTCIASCVDVPCVIVGNDESCLMAVDLVLPVSPRVIWYARITEAAIKSVLVSESGRVGVALTADGGAYLFSPLPSAGFGVRQQLETDGAVTALDSYERSGAHGQEDVIVFLATSNAELLSFVRVVVVRDCTVVGEATYGLDTVYTGLALHPTTNRIFTMAIQDRALCCFTLRDVDILLSERVSDLLWRPDVSAPSGHDLRAVLLRTVGRYLLSAADDGWLRGRSNNLAEPETAPLSESYSRQTHQASSGGVRALELSYDGRKAVLVGYDGTLMFVKLPYDTIGSGPSRRHRSTFFDPAGTVPESRVVAEMPALPHHALMEVPPTWREVVAEQAWRAHEEELRAKHDTIMDGVHKLREKVRDMLDYNAEQEEIDRLPENEFELDLDEQARIEEANEARVQEAKSEIIDQNARNMYARDQLKKQCWDAMDVKGKAVQGLMVELEVSNYPLKPRSDAFLAVLDGIHERRQLELEEKRLQAEILEPRKQAAAQLAQHPSTLGGSAESVEMEPGTPPGDESGDEEGPQQDTTHTGSTSHQLGVTNPWLLPQFSITTRKQRVEQIYMLQDVIYRLQQKFNEQFDAVHRAKCAEVQRISDWADRLRYIYAELKMQEEPWVPRLSAAEQPETLLTVSDDEVTVERYYTPAERARMEAAAAEEERRRREREANDFRERAIMQMMNGVLEVRWEDTLKKDVPRPEFMDTKDRLEWTAEEVKEAAEYERKVAELEEERDKYRRMLEQELKKLLVTVQETVDRFDEQQLSRLFTLKVQTQHAIDQEELKVRRLLREVAEEDQRDRREDQLCQEMDETQQRKIGLQTANADLRRALEAAKASLEPLKQQDKLLERSFRKEFQNVPANIVDALCRYFKRRPASLRRHMDASTRRATVAEEGVVEVDRRRGRRRSRSRRRSHSRRRSSKSPGGTSRGESISRDAGDLDGHQFRLRFDFTSSRDGMPYSEKKTVPGKRAILEAMKDLDDDSQRSEEIDESLWLKMCQLRQAKVLMEFEVLRAGASVAALVDSIEKRRHAEEALNLRSQSLISELAELREARLRQLQDQEVQLVLKQGQVEIDLGDFCPDFTGSALIHRSKVELLNKQILEIGRTKLDVMRDALRFRRGIVSQRWEYDRCRMTLEDLVQKLRDIAFMKVTRTIQNFLKEGGDTTEKQIARLEKRSEILQQEADRKRAEDAEVTEYLQRLLRMKVADNQRLSLQATELNVDVSERELLYDIRCNHQRRWQARQRLGALRRIRELCDIAGFQQRYMAMLQAELQRIYSRTFPILHAGS